MRMLLAMLIDAEKPKLRAAKLKPSVSVGRRVRELLPRAESSPICSEVSRLDYDRIVGKLGTPVERTGDVPDGCLSPSATGEIEERRACDA
jgi:hypothetical protein